MSGEPLIALIGFYVMVAIAAFIGTRKDTGPMSLGMECVRALICGLWFPAALLGFVFVGVDALIAVCRPGNPR